MKDSKHATYKRHNFSRRIEGSNWDRIVPLVHTDSVIGGMLDKPFSQNQANMIAKSARKRGWNARVKRVKNGFLVFKHTRKGGWRGKNRPTSGVPSPKKYYRRSEVLKPSTTPSIRNYNFKHPEESERDDEMTERIPPRVRIKDSGNRRRIGGAAAKSLLNLHQQQTADNGWRHEMGVGMMLDGQFKKWIKWEYERNEQTNHHQDNNQMLAFLFGRKDQISVMEEVIAQHKKRGYMEQSSYDYMDKYGIPELYENIRDATPEKPGALRRALSTDGAGSDLSNDWRSL